MPKAAQAPETSQEDMIKSVLFRMTQDPLWAMSQLLTIEEFGSGRLINLKLNSVQAALHARIESQKYRTGSVRRVVLKPRRSGLSTYVIARYFLASLLNSNQRILLVANSEETTQTLFSMVKLMEANFPDELKPAKLYSGKSELQWGTNDGRGRNTKYRLATVGGAAVVGDQINYLHLSEVSRWGNNASDYAGALLRTTRVGYGEQIIESTAHGVGGYFYDMYWHAASGETAWEADFFPWFSFSEYQAPFNDEKHQQQFLESLGTVERYGGEEEHDLLGYTYSLQIGEQEQEYTITPEHLLWRRQCIDDVCQGEIDQFHEDYPTTPEEAFLSSSRSVFRRSILLDWQQDSTEAERFRVQPVFGSHQELRFRIDSNPIGPLHVHTPPQAGREYRIGVDVAEGIEVGRRDADYSVAIVLDAVTLEEQAMLRLRCDPDELGQYLTALGRWYNQAHLIVERNNHGLVTLRSLQDHFQYPNIYSERVQDERGQRQTKKLGFLTTKKSRPQILGLMKEFVREGYTRARSPEIISEMLRFVVDANGREEAQEGSHDDCVMAYALALFGCQQIPAQTVPVEYVPTQNAYSPTRGRHNYQQEPVEEAVA